MNNYSSLHLFCPPVPLLSILAIHLFSVSKAILFWIWTATTRSYNAHTCTLAWDSYRDTYPEFFMSFQLLSLASPLTASYLFSVWHWVSDSFLCWRGGGKKITLSTKAELKLANNIRLQNNMEEQTILRNCIRRTQNNSIFFVKGKGNDQGGATVEEWRRGDMHVETKVQATVILGWNLRKRTSCPAHGRTRACAHTQSFL